MQKPFDLTIKQAKDPKQRHLEKAAAFINQLFSRHPPVEPRSQRLVTIRPPAAPESVKVWRLQWDISEEYLKSAWIFSGLRASKDDVKHGRRYVADIYQDGRILDYIVTPERRK